MCCLHPRTCCFIIILALGAVAVLLYALSSPRGHPPDLRVDSLTLSITANWTVDFAVLNRNKKTTMYFDHLEATVYHRDTSLSTAAILPFLVRSDGNRTAIRATFVAVGADWDEKLVEGINVRVFARVRLRSRLWLPNWDHHWTLYCGDLAVGMMNSSTSNVGWNLVGGPRECLVDASW